MDDPLPDDEYEGCGSGSGSGALAACVFELLPEEVLPEEDADVLLEE